jgi:hypothetical protein
MSGPLTSSGRGIALRLAAGAVVLAATVALAGCSSGASTKPTSTPSATKSAAAAKSTPKPKPTPTFAALTYTCDNILPPATLAVFKSKKSDGFVLQDDYLQRMQNIGSMVVAFSTYGGILCQWSYPDAENSVDYAFSAITSDQASTQQQALTSAGYVGAPKDHGTLYTNTDTADYPDEYLFINGYWFQASSDAVMQLLVDNVFVLPS